MAEHRTVADALLDGLAAHGVGLCFGLPGVHNLPFWVGEGQDGRPRIVPVRHEQAAGYAADAAARTTGGLGVVLTTTGPGFANALAAFGEAWASFSPVLLISSEAPLAPRRRRGSDDALLHGMRSQAAMVSEGFGAMAHSATDAADAVAALPRLVAHSLTTGRPTYLGVPSDVLHEEYSGPAAEPIRLRLPEPAHDDVEAAAAALRGRSVVIWAGARAVAAEAQIGRLAERLGALVVPTYQARGLLADYAGTVQAPPHEPPVARAIAERDVLLVIGDDLHGMTTRNWRMPRPSSVVAVVDDASLSLGDWPLEAKVCGHVPSAVRALADALGDLEPQPAPDGAGLTAESRAEIAANPRTADASVFLQTIETAVPADASVVIDMCVAGYWTGQTYQPRPRRLVHPIGWGTLGFGLPASIGPAALGRTTLAVVGDGGAAMGIGELATFVQERLPVVLLLVDDGGYGMLRYDQQVAGDPERGVDLVAPDWGLLAQAYGWGFARTSDPGEGLAVALQEAFDGVARGEQRMVVLDACFTPPRTQSPRWNEH